MDDYAKRGTLLRNWVTNTIFRAADVQRCDTPNIEEVKTGGDGWKFHAQRLNASLQSVILIRKVAFKMKRSTDVTLVLESRASDILLYQNISLLSGSSLKTPQLTCRKSHLTRQTLIWGQLEALLVVLLYLIATLFDS